MSSKIVACVCCFLLVSCEAVEKESSWSSTNVVFANTSVAWYPHKEDTNFKTKSIYPRAFPLDNGDNNNNNNNLGNIDRAFEFDGIGERDDFKAVPISTLSNTQTSPPSSSTHFHSVIKPPASQVFSSPQTSYGAPQQQQSSYYPSSFYGAPQYLPPSTSQTLHIENLDSYQPQYNLTSGNLEVNTKNQLFIQPGKCSNSIEVGRVRDVEVRTAFKYGSDIQKGVCVLMLYAANELNKLAIAMQPVEGTTNVVPTGTWLETNVKIYALQAGEFQPVITKPNFGVNSPALILTRSNIVVFSFYVDRSVDFFLDISTYQSPFC